MSHFWNDHEDIDWCDLLLAIGLVGAILLLLGLKMQAEGQLPLVTAPIAPFAMPMLEAEPPPDFFCAAPGTPGVKKDHECSCEHKCMENRPTTVCDTDEQGDQTNCREVPAEPGKHVEENAKCKVYCKPKQCTCPIQGCEMTE